MGYLFLLIAWRPLFGIYGANVVALAICTLFNTAVHRELAGRVRTHRGRLMLAAGALFGISVALTSARPVGCAQRRARIHFR